MILKCNNEKVVNLVKYFETLDFADKLRLSIDMLESYHVKVKNDNVLEILKKLLCAVDEQYNKTKFLNLLNYKHLLITSAQVMELTEKEQNIFVFEVFYNIYKVLQNKIFLECKWREWNWYSFSPCRSNERFAVIQEIVVFA